MASSQLGIQIKSTPMGKGVFAARPFRKSQVIGQMTGSVITDDNYDPEYVVDLGKAGVLEPAAPFRFLNHSCEPNAALIEYEPEANERPTMWVETLRAIKPGDQVTIDYGWPADSAIRCLCGAKRCRGWVVAESELPKVLRRIAKEAKAAEKLAAEKRAARQQAASKVASKKASSKSARKSGKPVAAKTGGGRRSTKASSSAGRRRQVNGA